MAKLLQGLLNGHMDQQHQPTAPSAAAAAAAALSEPRGDEYKHGGSGSGGGSSTSSRDGQIRALHEMVHGVPVGVSTPADLMLLAFYLLQVDEQHCKTSGS